KQHGTLRQVKLRGLDRVGLLFTLAATVVNLRRLPKLLTFEASA
ncbi:MAG: IS5/IS1182 family transposase, partial [Gammaproteobacteria bacterium]|nr:IS5/IS1182 family transposase [Gammaproteobacteria bacterium]